VIYHLTIFSENFRRFFFFKAIEYPLTLSGYADELFKRVNRAASELTAELGRPVTMRDVLLRLFKADRLKPEDFAWSWRSREIDAVENRQAMSHPDRGGPGEKKRMP
jgi:hypothetical protein